jgi:hypothetical protein
MRVAAPIALVILLASATRARAGGARVQCTVRSVHALKAEGGVDAKLEPLRHILEKEPFTAYRTFRLLEEQVRVLQEKVAAEFKLVNGKALTLTFQERLIDEKNRTRLRVLVVYPGLNTQQKIGDGATIPLVVGEHKGGSLLLATTCKTQ